MPSSGSRQCRADPVDQPDEVRARVVGDRLAVLVVEVDRVHQLAVDVELELVYGGVADAHRARAAVAGEVVGSVSSGSSWRPSMPYMIWSEPSGFELVAARLDPAHERAGLVGVAEPHEGVERERRVADPGVAVVPVAHAADLLGQAEGGRGDDRAVLLRDEQLQRQRGAVDHLAPAALVAAAADPVAPEVHGLLEALGHVVGRASQRSVRRAHPRGRTTRTRPAASVNVGDARRRPRVAAGPNCAAAAPARRRPRTRRGHRRPCARHVCCARA